MGERAEGLPTGLGFSTVPLVPPIPTQKGHINSVVPPVPIGNVDPALPPAINNPPTFIGDVTFPVPPVPSTLLPVPSFIKAGQIDESANPTGMYEFKKEYAAPTPMYGVAIDQRTRIQILSSMSPPSDLETDVQLGRDRARKIISMFQETEKANLETNVQLGRKRALKIISMFQEARKADDSDMLDPPEFGRKRRACLDKLKERKRSALLKNLEYVARVEDERLKERLTKVQEAQEYQNQMDDYHKQVLEFRSKHSGANKSKETNNILNTQAGLGTEQRLWAEKKRKQQTKTASSDSVALYVSNLPTDGSANTELMEALFGSYGSLRKIHLYRNKQTGDLKGDALVVYNLKYSKERSKLTEDVCSQMNGAELPCGTRIKVQPSDPLYQLRKNRQMDFTYGPASQQTEEAEREEAANSTHYPRIPGDPTDVDGSPERDVSSNKIEPKQVDDGLSDFFASVEEVETKAAVEAEVKKESEMNQRGDTEEGGTYEKAETKDTDEEDDLDEFFASLA